MKLLTLLFVLGLSWSAQAEVECTGSVRTIADGGVKTERVELAKTFDTAASFGMEGDVGLIHFSVHAEKDDSKYLLIISEGPEYTSGNTMAGTWTENGQIRATRVNGNDVYRLVCRR